MIEGEECMDCNPISLQKVMYYKFLDTIIFVSSQATEWEIGGTHGCLRCTQLQTKLNSAAENARQ
jgi:hypothetical protein